MVQTLPLLILLVLVNIYILFKIPTMTTAYSLAVLAATAEAWAGDDGDTGRDVNGKRKRGHR